MLTEVSRISFPTSFEYNGVILFQGDNGLYEQEVFAYFDYDENGDESWVVKRYPIIKLERVDGNNDIYLSSFTTRAWNKQQSKAQPRHHYWVKLSDGEWTCTNRKANATRILRGKSAFDVVTGRVVNHSSCVLPENYFNREDYYIDRNQYKISMEKIYKPSTKSLSELMELDYLPF